MRANYAASLAAVSVTGYITGAGDRHLENFLMHTASGTLIPIDFGCDPVTAVGCLSCRQHTCHPIGIKLLPTPCSRLQSLSSAPRVDFGNILCLQHSRALCSAMRIPDIPQLITLPMCQRLQVSFVLLSAGTLSVRARRCCPFRS